MQDLIQRLWDVGIDLRSREKEFLETLQNWLAEKEPPAEEVKEGGKPVLVEKDTKIQDTGDPYAAQ